MSCQCAQCYRQFGCYVECDECHHNMVGILNRQAREVCHECGGEALNVHERNKSDNELRQETSVG